MAGTGHLGLCCLKQENSRNTSRNSTACIDIMPAEVLYKVMAQIMETLHTEFDN
uniref:Uncharacterized protein n=1 Tax=Anguilla anguilla TaxID=7936 RepID=A0A0E9QH07_ANGAN